MKRLSRKLLVFICIIYISVPWQAIFLQLDVPGVEAASLQLTSRVDFDNGLYNGVESKTKEGEIKLKADGTWGPRVWKNPNLTLSDQAAVVSDGTYVYVLNSNENYFSRYLPLENRWQTLVSAPHFGYFGTDLVVLGNYIYAIFGGYQREFSRYSIADNTWTEKAVLPDLAYYGSSLTTDGTYIYALHGNNTSDFWRYNPVSNIWESKLSTPNTIYYGSSMVYYNGYIFALRGNSNTMYRYQISSNTWDLSANTPANAPASFADDLNMDIVGDDIYVARGNSTAMYRYNISTTAPGTWDTLAAVTPQTNRYVGLVYNSSEANYIYVFRGNGTGEFWKYDINADRFVGSAELPAAPNTGGDLVWVNGSMYGTRGGANTNLYKFAPVSNTWTAMTSIPASFSATLNDDTKAVAVYENIYFLRGSNTTTFLKYNTVTDTWYTLAVTLAGIGSGGTLVYPGGAGYEDYIYATRGGVSRIFYRYSISGNSWSDIAVADLPDNAEAGAGSRLVTNGTNIYYIGGSGIAQFYRYALTDSWILLGSVPFSPYYGTDLAYYNGKIYAQAGYYKTDFWEYSVAGGTWRQLQNMEGYLAGDVGPYAGGSLESDGAGILYSTTGTTAAGQGLAATGITQMQTYTVSSYNYPVSGTWTSGVQDLTYVSAWGTVNSTSTMPSPLDSAGITFDTRTSTDSADWSDWYSVAGDGTVDTNLPKKRYYQVRSTITSTSIRDKTPLLLDVTLNYTGDSSPPSAPSNPVGKSQPVGGVALQSGITHEYKYTNPYFSWDSSSDGQTSIAGYYVYFGTDPNADPTDSSNGSTFQTNTNYTVTTPLSTGSYYLRVAAKDAAGNPSSVLEAFTYKYAGVSPPQSIVATSTSDFSLGSTSSASILDDEIKLASQSSFWSQQRLSVTLAAINWGGSLAYVSSSNKLYVTRGGNALFDEYDIATDTWTNKSNLPAANSNGGSIVEGPSGYLYGMRGGGAPNGGAFWKYTIGGSWDDAGAVDAPQPVSFGGDLVYDGSRYIYALKGNTDDTFMRYDSQGDSWDTLVNVDFGAPENQINNYVDRGGALAFDGQDKIYAIQGGLRSGFASYTISGNIVTDSWTPLANTPTITYDGAQIAYDSTTNAIYLLAGNSTPYFYKYDISSQTWSSLTDVPTTIGAGAAMRNVNGILYVLRGAGSTTFYKYNIAKASWVVPNMGLFGGILRGTDFRTFGEGADIVKGDGNNYYITRGTYDNLFARYNATSGEMVKMADVPAGIWRGSELVYDSIHNKIYATVSLYLAKFYVYDIATDTWSLVGDLPFDTDTGSSMTFDGSQYIYLTRGNGNTTFYRFDTVGQSWGSALAPLPAGGTSSGGDIVYKNGYVYALRGNTTVKFYRYAPSPTNTWSDPVVADLPAGANVAGDGFLVDGGGDFLYACRGGNTNICYQYSINRDAWTQTSNAPANITTGGAAASNGIDRMYVIAGAGTNTFSDGLYSFVMQSNTSAFAESGSYTSPTYDLSSIYKFSDLNVTYIATPNATLTVYTRTSANSSTWSDWTVASTAKTNGNTYNYGINSTPQRYLQVRFDFTSGNGIYSGRVQDYTIHYYQDTVKPTNPTSLDAYSTSTQSGTLTITDPPSWYNYSAPNFDWPDAEGTGGATDTATGSGILGYYVYFGTSQGADPSSDGNYQTDTSYTASSLTSGNSYYLRIKTKDNAGNISDDTWQPFIYKFDSVAPDNPTTVIASPPGYSATNSFDFSWSGATDSASEVSEYCYKLGSTGSEHCGVTDSSIDDLQAYTTGTNTFYVRAKDAAGNTASSYANIPYYYNSTSPGAPQNLAVTYPVGSSSNSVNEFAFSWDPPASYYGQQSGLRYYYSVNALPTANNVNSVGLSVTYLSSDAYATQKGTNNLYVVAKDEAGNIDYNTYASVEFTADTSAPGIPQNLDISDVSIKETSAWRLALSWNTPESSGSGIAAYKVYRSETSGADCNSDFTQFSYDASTSQTSYVDTGLTQVKKYYCITACDSTSQCSAVSDTVSFYPDGKWKTSPTLTANPSVTVKTKTADISWSTSRDSNSFVKYGKTSGTYGEEVGSSEQVTSHEITLSGLDPGTTYYYKVLWTDEDGNLGSSSEYNFSTNSAPFVSAVKATSVSLYSAYITFTIKNAVQATIQYGKTTTYGGTKTISTSRSESSYTVLVDSLLDGTKYHYRIQGVDDEGNTYNGDDYTFDTLPVPKILSPKIQQVAGMPTATLRVLWTSNAAISSIITYYPTTYPERSRDLINLAAVKIHEMIIKDLSDETEYTIIISGKDSAGNEAKADAVKAKTATDFRPPEVQNLDVESTIVGVGDNARAQIAISWDTDEPASTQVEYGEGTGTIYSATTQEDTSLTLNHTVTIPGLSPARIYHLRPASKDKAGNAANVSDTVIITPSATKDALNLVVDKLSKTFGFLKGTKFSLK